MSQYTSYDDILEEAKNPHVAAGIPDILVSRTRKLTAEKKSTSCTSWKNCSRSWKSD
ncbi:MAG: hypothetical protein R3208_06190 [Ketobacteraceae bacterium]|nr:hypothetical protein [Ketobacteraceae bacterium]